MEKTNEEIIKDISKDDDGTCEHDFWEVCKNRMYVCKKCKKVVTYVIPIVEGEPYDFL